MNSQIKLLAAIAIAAFMPAAAHAQSADATALAAVLSQFGYSMQSHRCPKPAVRSDLPSASAALR